MEREEFDRINVFGLGNENIDYAQYFIGKSYLNYLTKIDDAKISLFNVTFEPRCRNNWHIHINYKFLSRLYAYSFLITHFCKKCGIIHISC